MKQLSFFEDSVFGGEALKGNPRGVRPIKFKNALYVSFKTSTNKDLKLKNSLIRRIIKKQSRAHKIKIHKSLISKNSIQLLINVKSQRAYSSFIRATTGLIARLVLKAQKGSPKGVKFWIARPFSKIISMGKEFISVKKYISKPYSKAVGFKLKTTYGQYYFFPLSGYS